ncbi:hypothetical protein PG987_001906 [Apiospora arundinis]
MASARGTVLVTGANGTLGSAIVEQISSDSRLTSYHAIYTVRDATRVENLPSDRVHEVVSLDLTKPDNVREVAKDINARVSSGEIPPIRALILAAGYLDFGKQSCTSDGIDITFAANYLGHWLLTLMLLESMDKTAGRIVYIGSQAQDVNDARNNATGAFTDPRYKTFISNAESFKAIAKGAWGGGPEEPGYRTGFRRYGASKFFLVTMQHELQARLDADPQLNRLCVIGVDPGNMASGLQRLAPWFIRVVIWQIVYPFLLRIMPDRAPLRQPSRPAGEVLEVAFGLKEEPELPKDKYFHERALKETNKESQDPAKKNIGVEGDGKPGWLEGGRYGPGQLALSIEW